MTMLQQIDRATWWALVPVLAVALIWPAFWNGYPLMFFDSGDYLALSVLLEPLEFRTLPYSILIRLLHWQTSGWPIVLFQGLVAAWTVRETVAAFCPRWRGLIGAAIGSVLVCATGLPWVAGQIMPDVYAGVAILAMALLLSAPLPGWRRAILGAIAFAAIACHATHTLVAIGLVVLAVLLLRKLPQAKIRIALAAAIVVAAIAAVPLANYLTVGEVYYSRGGTSFLLGRLVQDGVAKKYLDLVCPDPAYKLCAYKDALPETHNDFLWGETEAFDSMGGWQYGAAESDRIVYGSLRRLPFTVLWTGLQSGLLQLTLVHSIEGFGQKYKFLAEAIDLVLPGDYERFNNSLQQREMLSVRTLNRLLYTPFQLAVFAALALWTAWRWRQMSAPLRAFCLLILAGLIANAFICGGLSNPLHRYQGRVVWLAVVALGVALAAHRQPTRTP